MPTFAVQTSTGQTIRVHAPDEEAAKRHVDILGIRGELAAGVKVEGTPVAAAKIK